MTAHAIERAWERYGLALLPSELDALTKQIQGGRAVLLSQQPEGTDVYIVLHSEHALQAIYDPRVGRIITFLPSAAQRQRHSFAKPRSKHLRRKEHAKTQKARRQAD